MLDDIKYLIEEIENVSKKNKNEINADAIKCILDCCYHLHHYLSMLTIQQLSIKERMKEYEQRLSTAVVSGKK